MMLAIDEEKGINVLLNVLKIDTNKLTPDIELDPESSCQFRERLLHISASDARTLTLSTIEAYRFLLLFFNRRIDYEYEGIEYHYALSQVKVSTLLVLIRYTVFTEPYCNIFSDIYIYIYMFVPSKLMITSYMSTYATLPR